MSGSEYLNESDRHTYKNVLTSGSQYLESDCDEQVMDRWIMIDKWMNRHMDHEWTNVYMDE